MKTYSRYYVLLIVLLITAIHTNAARPVIDSVRTKERARMALQFCRQRGFNTRYCILIDMSLPSGVKRFMVWDFRAKKIHLSGLVSHGCGNAPWAGIWTKDKPQFSNVDGSHCTSTGKYRVDGRGYSAWGIHVKYFLAGLEKTNSNALARQIVFHSWNQVAEDEVYPNGTPEGWGCPAVSNNTMTAVDALIGKQSKRMLLWIYN